MSPVARLGEASRDGLGANAELERAVALEEEMECFVEYLRETKSKSCEPWQDLLNRLAVLVDLGRQHLDEMSDASPTSSPEEQAGGQLGGDKDPLPAPVKTEYGECSSSSLFIKGSGSDVKVAKQAEEGTSLSEVKGRLSLSFCRGGASHSKVEPGDNLLFETGEEKTSAVEGIISPKGKRTGTYLHLKAELGPHVRMSAQCSLLPNSGGKAVSEKEGDVLLPAPKVARLAFEAEIEADDSEDKSKKMRLSPAYERGVTKERSHDMSSQVRSDILVWVEGAERTLKETGGGMTDAVGRLRAAVSEPGVKSAVVNQTGQDVLRKIGWCLDAPGENADMKEKELAEHHKSLDELLVRQLHKDSTDEVC